jgi:hypothetical protein
MDYPAVGWSDFLPICFNWGKLISQKPSDNHLGLAFFKAVAAGNVALDIGLVSKGGAFILSFSHWSDFNPNVSVDGLFTMGVLA